MLVHFKINTGISHLSGPSLLGNLSPPAHQDALALQQRSLVLLKKSLEDQGDLVDPGDQEHLHVLGDLARTVLEHRFLPSDLSLLGSRVIQVDLRRRQLEVLVLLEVLLNLKETGGQHLHQKLIK